MKKRVTIVTFLATLIFGGTAVLANMYPSLAATEHCPDHNGHPGKVQSVVDGDLDNIVPLAGTLICVKASNEASEIIVANGTSTLGSYVTWGNHNVSYYITYAQRPTDAPTDAPTDVPTDTPTDVPTDTPTDVPTETPTDVPTEVPTRTPSDEVPDETPTPTVTSTPSSTSVPEPTRTPTEAPTPRPTPHVEPTPTVVPPTVSVPPVAPPVPSESGMLGPVNESSENHIALLLIVTTIGSVALARKVVR